MSQARGFSLLELVVTLVIAGILAAVALPFFSDRETNATWFREQVKAALRYGQRQAVANRRLVYVFIDPGQVRLCFDNPCTVPNELTAYHLLVPSGVAIGTTTNFSFDGLGRPSLGATLSFTVGGGPVTVQAETGYVL
jgi:MSHA pilin protein MshC